MTSFLVSVFIVFLLFPSEIAYLCLGFIIIGDLISKYIGIKYGRNHLIHDRTLEGVTRIPDRKPLQWTDSLCYLQVQHHLAHRRRNYCNINGIVLMEN